MALSWNPQAEKPVGMVADRNLYLDKSGEHLAAENSVESASLLIGKGKEIEPPDIARLNLVVVDGRVEQKSAALEAAPSPSKKKGKEQPAGS